MAQYNLNRIFKPRQVAVVGASKKTGTIGNALMRNLVDGGFSGTVLPVNPKYQTMHGQESAPLDDVTLQAFDAFLPDFWSRSNPIDILGDASAERFSRALAICFNSKKLDGVLVILAPQSLTDPLSVAETLAAAIQGRRFPIFACWMGGKRIAPAVDVLNAAGIPTYDTPERAVRAFLYMVEYVRNLELKDRSWGFPP
ncbi:CoA-binding protein [uncultured Desulfosarcina sp.]|uniref:CoA-binding protein n=1 Tax=uncultured Desulfosarcina sp. TaxID=218289 RepID=UPI0029C956FE|nr:CoA-binding protein [uncultured Desulfosarcina sp.]